MDSIVIGGYFFHCDTQYDTDLKRNIYNTMQRKVSKLMMYSLHFTPSLQWSADNSRSAGLMWMVLTLTMRSNAATKTGESTLAFSCGGPDGRRWHITNTCGEPLCPTTDECCGQQWSRGSIADTNYLSTVQCFTPYVSARWKWMLKVTSLKIGASFNIATIEANCCGCGV